MALATGTNTLIVQVINDEDQKVKFQASWLSLDYSHLLALEKALITSSLDLGISMLPKADQEYFQGKK